LNAQSIGGGEYVVNVDRRQIPIQSIDHWVRKINPSVTEADRRVMVEHLILNAKANHLPLDLLVAVITYESTFKADAVSPTGALGIAQVIPSWHQKKIKGRNLKDIKVGLEVGSSILKDCYIKGKRKYDRTLRCYSGYNEEEVAVYINKVERYRKNFRTVLAAKTEVYNKWERLLVARKQPHQVQQIQLALAD
jgi:soluble lytic murein transglycosylase-like protein